MLTRLLRKLKGSSNVHMSPRALKQWLAQLPVLDLPKCLVQIDGLLFQWKMLAKTDTAWQLQLVTLFATVQEISHRALQKYAHDQVDSEQARRALLFYVRNIHWQMAIQGHYLSNSNGHLTDSERHLLLGYTLFSLAMVILRSYQLLSTPPKGTWQRFYQVYLETKALEKRSTKGFATESYYHAKTTLHPFYAIILISTCDPFRQSPEHLDELFEVFLAHIDGGDFIQSHEEASYRFSFVTTEDRSPMLAVTMTAKQREQANFIDLSCLEAWLSAQVSEGDSLITKQLKDVWQKSYKRRSERIDSTGQANILAGLYQCVKFDGGSEMFDEVNSADLLTNFRYSDRQNPYWQNIIENYRRTLSIENGGGEPRQMLWYVHNQSENGVSVTSHASLPLNELNIGQFALIHNIDTHQQIGSLIRWVTVDESGIVALGLEYLGRENTPLRLQNESQRQQKRYSFGMMTKYVQAPWPTQVLVTQLVGYQPGDKLYLIYGQYHLEVKLKAMLEQTTYCQFFSFEPIALGSD